MLLHDVSGSMGTSRPRLANRASLAYTRANFADARKRLSGFSGNLPTAPEPISPVELFEVDMRKKVFLYAAAVAFVVSGLAVFLVHRLVDTAGDAQLARQIGWNLLAI